MGEGRRRPDGGNRGAGGRHGGPVRGRRGETRPTGLEGDRPRLPRVVTRLIGVLTASYLIAWTVNRSLVDVRGGSMEPALRPGDRLLTLPAWPGACRPGRVVVVTDPTDPDHLLVKRIATVVGDTVTVLGDHAAASTDSRVWGPLPASAVRRVVVRRWPDLRTHLHRTR